MRQHRMLVWVAAVLLIGGGFAWAQTATAIDKDARESRLEMTGHAMAGYAMMGAVEEPAVTPSMAECRQMLAARQGTKDRMQEMDARLDALLETMNAAKGGQKVDATAAVVAELVAQRSQVRTMMASMQPMMMRHMVQHMRSGVTRGMKISMSDCPMMGGEEPESAEHGSHH